MRELTQPRPPSGYLSRKPWLGMLTAAVSWALLGTKCSGHLQSPAVQGLAPSCNPLPAEACCPILVLSLGHLYNHLGTGHPGSEAWTSALH